MHQKTASAWISAEGAAAFLLRFALGVLFFSAGLTKLLAPGGPAAVSEAIMEGFKDTYLPVSLTWAFLRALPFIELIVGALLIVGLFTRETLVVCGLLLIALAFGKSVQGDHVTVAANLNYVLMAGVALWFAARDNRYSLDYIIWRR